RGHPVAKLFSTRMAENLIPLLAKHLCDAAAPLDDRKSRASAKARDGLCAKRYTCSDASKSIAEANRKVRLALSRKRAIFGKIRATTRLLASLRPQPVASIPCTARSLQPKRLLQAAE